MRGGSEQPPGGSAGEELLVDGRRVAIVKAADGGTEIQGEYGAFALADVPHQEAVACIGTVAAHLCDAELTAKPAVGEVPRLALTGTRDLLRDMLRRPDAPRERPRPTRRDADREKFLNYVRLQTARAVYNDRVAGALGVPYLASSVRVAAANVMIGQRHDMLMLLRRVFAESTHVAPEAEQFASYEPVRAPPVLAVLLERMRKHGGLEGLPAALTELRDESEPLRKALREHPDQLQWRHRPQGLFDAALPKPRSAASRRAQEATMLATQAAAGAGAGPVAAMATRSVQAALPADEGRDKIQKLLRPRLYIIPDLAKEAARMNTLSGQIEAI